MTAAKRWRDREQRWIAPGELFDARRFSVDVIGGVGADTRAKAFVAQHHYHGTYPSARFRVGLFGPGAELVGLAVFSHSAGKGVLEKHTGCGAKDSCELGRFVCLPSVAYNGETWMLARAFRFLRDEKRLTRVLSFSDPLEWVSGQLVVKPAHFGTIYQASNAIHVGPSSPRVHLFAPNGRPISPRALSKLRNGSKGREYAERQLLEAGCPPRIFGEEPGAWVARLRNTGALVARRHAGNITYVFGLTDESRADLNAMHDGGLPYPKKVPDLWRVV